jgi:hypothetical protein
VCFVLWFSGSRYPLNAPHFLRRRFLGGASSDMGFSEARRAISFILFFVHEAMCITYLVNTIRRREHITVLQVRLSMPVRTNRLPT